MNNRPKVSVVIPCYNQSQFSFEAVLSAKYAYGGPKEVVIVNDGSTDGTTLRRLEYVKEALSDNYCEIYIINQSNFGSAAARNAGLERITGEYVQFLDCDDLLIKDKIDLQIKHFQTVAGLDVSISGCLYANEHLDRFATHEGLIADFDFLLKEFCLSWERGFSIPIHTALFSKTLLDKHRFDSSGVIKSKEDWEFWTRIAYSESKIAYLRIRGAVYRVHNASMCRALPDQGEHWMRAASAINAMIGGKIPGFLEKSEVWKSECYDKNPVPLATQSRAISPSKTELDRARSLRLKSPIRSPENGSPRLSVIVPVYNHYENLLECFQSIVDQSAVDMEVLLIDDGSTDPRVRELLESIPKSVKVRVIYNPSNCGISKAQNTGIENANGEFIVFVDCDDFLASDSLSKAITFIDRHGGCDYFFSDHNEVASDGGLIRLVHYGGYSDERFTGNLRQDLVNGMVANHLKIIRKDSLVRAGYFNQKCSGVQDWEMALRIQEFGRFLYLPEPLYSRRIHAATVTSSDMRGQFHLTNVVRRLYAEKFLSPDRDGNGPVVLDSSGPLNVLDVLERWKRSSLTLDTTKLLSIHGLWWIREFNSYFDEILWNSPEVYAALVGYVWSPKVLRRV
jgi:glycosyltransferase involved in cell wall biosynthesis